MTNDLRQLLEATWNAKEASALEGPYRGGNLRAEAAARYLTGGERLLDVGCGAGTLALLVSGRYRAIHGLDLSERAVGAARARGVDARVLDVNAGGLPYETGFFDAVTLLSVLQYVFDPPRLLAEVARVTKPGGRVLVGFPNMRAAWRVARLGLAGRFPRVSRDPGYDGGTIHYFCTRDVADLMHAAGLPPDLAIGVFTLPPWLEGRTGGWPVMGALTREFLSGEILLAGRRSGT